MTRVHADLDFLARVLALPVADGLGSSDARFHAALAGTDTLIVDAVRRSYHRLSDTRPLKFEETVQDGIAQATLHLQGNAGIRTIALTSQDETFWTPLPDPRVVGLPRIAQRHAASWASPAQPTTPDDRPRHKVREWLASSIALAVLAVFAAFGFNALLWSMAGGWKLLWLLVGLPVFPTFTALTLFTAYRLVRPAVPPRAALDAIEVSRDERFRIGEPLAFRMTATVPASLGRQRMQAPQRVTARLVVQAVHDAPDGSWSLVDDICSTVGAECVPAAPDSANEGRVHYAGSLTTTRTTPRHAHENWFLALYGSEEAGAEPFHVTSLATPTTDAPWQPVWHPDRHTQLEALLHDKGWELVLKAYNGEDASWGLARETGSTYREDFTPAERQAVFTIDLEALVDHAMATRWYEGEIHSARIGGDGSMYLLHENQRYKLMFTERAWTEVLYETPDLRDAVARYLVADKSFVADLPGAEAMKVRSPYR